jgi:hypothetical protein
MISKKMNTLYPTNVWNGITYIPDDTVISANQVKVGSKWICAGGEKIVNVDKVIIYPSSDHEVKPSYVIHYSWEENGENKTNNEDYILFKMGYFLILEDSGRTGTVNSTNPLLSAIITE